MLKAEQMVSGIDRSIKSREELTTQYSGQIHEIQGRFPTYKAWVWNLEIVDNCKLCMFKIF
jgi:hypothetical protein